MLTWISSSCHKGNVCVYLKYIADINRIHFSYVLCSKTSKTIKLSRVLYVRPLSGSLWSDRGARLCRLCGLTAAQLCHSTVKVIETTAEVRVVADQSDFIEH